MNATEHRARHHHGVHIMACSFLTFRYEWRYLSEWIAHHSLVGVDLFAFWLDTVTTDPVHNAHERSAAAELEALAKKLPGVSVFERQRGADGKLEEQGVPLLRKCREHAHAAGADWVFEADIDETLLTGPFVLEPTARLPEGDAVPTAVEPALCKGSAAQRSLGVARALQAVPQVVAALALPRFEFYHGGVAEPPPGLLQSEAYTWRDVPSDRKKSEQDVLMAPKMMVRVSGMKSPVSNWNTHWVHDEKRLVIRSTDGMPLALNLTAGGVWQNASYAHRHVFPHPLQARVATHGLRMYHYMTRSRAECERKRADTARAIDTGAIPSNWRASSPWAAQMCNPHDARQRFASLRRDVSAACLAALVRDRVELQRAPTWPGSGGAL